ncbi:putative serine/threonine-protein kinase-like protein CCR3 [Acorus calamus]|uniref:Serine/threonine-protein kinase-like protein CCR3 n=1 Tax=Acorus calamus TaxID=4465 RepID=A0AAV9E2I1_ACOCL|nr:putative serine/threonine-protein kinase-like protein CCR3 [Acorus calamus]
MAKKAKERSGTSHPDHVAEEFRFAELAKATENFSPENRISAGSFGTVYKRKLDDRREVTIKRGERTTKRVQEKENAFQSELAFLSRLHHKHLVGLVGFCEEEEEGQTDVCGVEGGVVGEEMEVDMKGWEEEKQNLTTREEELMLTEKSISIKCGCWRPSWWDDCHLKKNNINE